MVLNALWFYRRKNNHPTACIYYLPKTRIFLPAGNLDLDRVETSLSIEDLEKEHHSRWNDVHTSVHTYARAHTNATHTLPI